jgi:hypothetical protein
MDLRGWIGLAIAGMITLFMTFIVYASKHGWL